MALDGYELSKIFREMEHILKVDGFTLDEQYELGLLLDDIMDLAVAQAQDTIHDDAFSDGYQEGLVVGRSAGYEDGYEAGKEYGLDKGYYEGKDDGYKSGKEDGRAEGEDHWYHQGFQDGLACEDNGQSF